MARMTLTQNLASTAETLKAYWRQGLHELGNALYGPGTAAAAPEYGMVGTEPPSEVAKGLTGQAARGQAHHEPAVEPSSPSVEPDARSPHANAEPASPQPSALDRYTEPLHEPPHEPMREPERTAPALEPDRD